MDDDDYDNVPEGFFPEDYVEEDEDDLEYELFTRSTLVSDYAIPRWNDCLPKFAK